MRDSDEPRRASWVTRRAGLAGLAAGAGLGAAGALAACAAGGGAPPVERLKEATATIHYLSSWPVDRLPIIERWKEAYREDWPRVAVEVELVTDFNTKFQVGLSAGTPPDVVRANSFAQTRWYDAGAHLDLAPLLARDRINLQRDYALMGIEVWCGKTFALPMDAGSYAVFYNKTLLQRLGLRDPWADGKGDWTLDDLATMARRVSQFGDREGQRVWGLWDTYGHPSYVAQYVWTHGGDVADFQAMRYTLDSPVSLKVHQLLYDWLAKDRLLLPGPEAQAIAREAPGKDAFSAGRAAFRVRAVDDVTRYMREVQGAFEWDVLPFPRLDAQHPGIAISSGNPHCVTKESKAPEQAYHFAKLIATARGQEILGETLSLPALKAKQEVYLKGKSPAQVKVFQDVYSRPYGIHFRHHFTDDSFAVYARQMDSIYFGQAPLVGTVQETNRLMNETVKYGDCQPYRGVTIPIRPR